MATAAGALRLLESTEASVIVLEAEGDLDLQTAPGLCVRLTVHRGGRVVLDLTRLRFCDSCGLRALVGEDRETRARGGRQVVVAPAGGSARRMFELTGVAEIIEVVESRADALARLLPLRAALP
ncbi:MAG TPA: STAS domain-containing protein [Solirubrobacteraceae bacterium]|jgi:anti-anti-sigma factor|nr:STAS domain-containing protein [Solirubrobacteraceae bacterium]